MSNARFSITQSRAVGDPRVSNAQFRTLAALGTFGDKDGWCFPKLATVGAMLGKSKQAVSQDLRALAELGYLEIHPQYREDGSQMHNRYRLKFDLDEQTGKDVNYPRKRDVYPHQVNELDPPLSSELDPPLSSELDALTPHINAPINAPVVEESQTEQQPNIFEIYEREVGALTKYISEELQDMEKEFPDGWFEKAVREARRSSTRVSLKYIRAILVRWKAEGLPTEYRDKSKETPKKRVSVQFPFGQVSEVIT